MLSEGRRPAQKAPPWRDAHLPPLRCLAETQLAIQFSRAGAYDAQALGILGLDAALAAAAVAGDQLLGHLWWLALIGLLLSAVSCAAILVTRVDQIGPRVDDLIDEAQGLSESEMERLLVEALGESIRRNGQALEEKSDLTLIAILVLSVTIFGAIIGVLAS
jgi:hypothetical protein